MLEGLPLRLVSFPIYPADTMMYESSRDRDYKTLVQVRWLESSSGAESCLPRSGISTTIGEPKKNLLLEFYSWANKYFVDVCGTHVVGCCDKVRSL